VLNGFKKIDKKYNIDTPDYYPPFYGTYCHLFRTGVHIGGEEFNEVYPCIGLTKIIFGHLNEESLKNIIRSRIRQDFLSTLKNRVGHCLECEIGRAHV